MIHGLDLPDEVSEQNNQKVMKEVGITEDDIMNGIDDMEV